jgi:predicted acylesterase/phospholipase RssA/CRP-like cAMP-binding protein
MDTSANLRRMQVTSFLRRVPVLAALPDELLERLAAQAWEVHVPAGGWILREGDPADTMFIVASGRIEVIREGPPEALLRVLRRGDVIGELALLQEGVRSASARAQRDTELLELGRAEFESLIERVPSFAIGMARALAAQVAVSRGQRVSASPPRIVAVVGLDGAAPTAEVGETLADALGAHGSTVRLLSGDIASIARAERCSQRVVLVAPGPPQQEWTRLCLSEADVVLAVSTGRPDPAWIMQVSALRGCELLAIGTAVDEGMLQILQPREVQVMAEHLDRKVALDAMARRLAGQALGLVLSGGGARALAHIGVLEELRAVGLRFDRVAGVSMGALIAALVAMGLDGEEVYDVCVRGLVKKNPTRDFTLPVYSFIRGGKTRRLLHEVFGERRIEELPLRFFSLSCDLNRREAVVHRTGRLFDAVYPSLALPGVLPPVSGGRGQLLVDGAVLDNLPVSAMACRGEGPVIAVDATEPQHQFKPTQRPLPDRIGRPIRRVLTGSGQTIPRFTETIVRSMTVGSINSVAAARLHADLVITPAIEGIGLLDWKAVDRMRGLGRDAARKALDSDPGLLARLGAQERRSHVMGCR